MLGDFVVVEALGYCYDICCKERKEKKSMGRREIVFAAADAW